MLTDPQTFKTAPTNSTTGGTSNSLSLIKNDGLESIYKSSDGTLNMRVAHTYNTVKNGYARAQRLVRVEKTANVTDPVTGLTTSQTFSCHVVINEPVTAPNTSGAGLFTDQAIKDVLTGLEAWLDTTMMDKILTDQH